jgi:hypothetical protein
VALGILGLLALGVMPGAVEVDPPEIRLRGSDSRARIVVTRRDATGGSTDLTHDAGVRYESLDRNRARVDASGVVRPAGDGETRVRVITGAGDSASVRVVVDDFADRSPVRFAAEVVPVLTKIGCNAGACHGKASGQNGFRLSLLGSDPRFDFDSLVREGRGRRVFPAAPKASLMLLKPTGALSHGGGKRLEAGSAAYRTIERWIGQGMPFGSADEPALTGLEVHPESRVVARQGTQQVRVVARYADGSTADVTHLAQYQSNAADLAAVDGSGQVSALNGVGQAAIMARFGGQIAVARLSIPLGGDVPEWSPPPARNLVDRFIFAKLKELGIPPSAACTDAEFARRSALDLCGVLPSPREVESLETDRDPEKRVKWVDQLLDRPEYADRFARMWSAILRNKRALGPLSQPGTFAFHAWVRQSLAENKPYDRFVAEILTARGDASINPPVVWFRQVSTVEDQVDDTAQLFLGLRLQCARCHHHPLERWGQDDYYGFAAFFTRIGRKPGIDPVTPRIFVKPAGLATDPATGRTYSPRVLGGAAALDLGPEHDPRQALADWLRRPDNPFLSRALVNRYWKQFFGRGLVDPEDDLRVSNPPTHPELLDALAEDFVAQGFDLKRLVRTIATSRAYERSSEPNAWNAPDRQGFSRFHPRRLPAELLLDSIDTVAGTREAFHGLPAGFRAAQLPDEAFDSPGKFLDVFGRPKRESVCECERTSEANLSQRLHLLNSSEIERKVSSPEGRASRWASDPRSDVEKIVELYRLALSRKPIAEECAVCLAHLARRRGEGKLREGFEDLIWSLINTKEFAFVE